jgi:hypothetical protein
LARSDFRYVTDDDAYFCPQGKPIRTTGRIRDGKTRLYRASKFDCDRCPLKAQRCPNTPGRKIPRDINQEARDYAQTLVGTPSFEQSQRERKKVEMLLVGRASSREASRSKSRRSY